MHWIAAPEKDSASSSLEKRLWNAADQFRAKRRIKILESMARALYRDWFVHLRFPGHENYPMVPSPLGEIPEG